MGEGGRGYFGPCVYMTGSLVITLWFICPSVCLSLNITEFISLYLKFCMKLDQYCKKSDTEGILKNLNPGSKCQKLGVLGIFSETAYYQFLTFCVMVGSNRAHHLSMVV